MCQQCTALQTRPAYLSLMHTYQLLLRWQHERARQRQREAGAAAAGAMERERAGLMEQQIQQQQQEQQRQEQEREAAKKSEWLTNSMILTAWADLNDLLYVFEVRLWVGVVWFGVVCHRRLIGQSMNGATGRSILHYTLTHTKHTLCTAGPDPFRYLQPGPHSVRVRRRPGHRQRGQHHPAR